MTVDYTTGEIVASTELAPANASSELAVTSYLQQARDWLATAVESTGPEQIAAAKAEIATAAEATKQLGLSKEIREDAAEMVRRAEYALRKATLKAQAAGELATRSDTLRQSPKTPTGDFDKPAPSSFFTSKREYEDANAMANLGAAEFDDVIAEARDEGNLSRANVAQKARERANPNRARPRQAAENTLNTIESLANRAARETQKLTTDQIRRVKPNAAEWLSGIRNSIEVLQDLVNSLEEN